ncbi:MAG: hypothetical protein ACE5IJ_03340 [Thermoplasmata archaeon]
MVTAAEVLPWIVAAIGWTLAIVGIISTVYFGLRARRNEERARETNEKVDSLLRVIASLGHVFDLGGGRTMKVVMVAPGRLGLEYAQQLSANLTVRGDVQARKIPGAKGEEEE